MEGTNGDLTAWRKSTYSGGNGSNCVEVGGSAPVVLVRDTKDRERGPVLRVSLKAWRVFTAEIKGQH